jgi:uncharacterized protein involved in outer membrane biogenesis
MAAGAQEREHPMKTLAKAIGLGAALLAALLLLVLLLLATVSDWNRARPWINEMVSARIERPFAINGDLRLEWVRSVEDLHWHLPRPHISAEEIVIGNPTWAQAEALATVGRFTAVFDPLPLLHRAVVLPLLELERARVDLQRLEDGRNNWSFGEDDGKVSRWRFAPGALRIGNSHLQLDDAQRHLVLRAEADSYEKGLRWSAQGTLNGAPLRGHGMAGSLLALQDKETPYPIAFTLDAGETHIEASGTLSNPSQLAALDVEMKISGASMGDLYDLTNIVLPATARYATNGRLVGTLDENGGTWRYENFNGRVGDSDLHGTLAYESRPDRVPLLRGELTSRLLDFVDLGPIIGVEKNGSTEAEAEETRAESKVLPAKSFASDRLASIDADVKFDAERIVVKSDLPIEELHAVIRLENGVLTLAPLDFGVAGGDLVSTIRIDAREKPLAASIDITSRGLKLSRLVPATESEQATLGEINGTAALTASGDSVASLLGSANGEVRLFVDRGTVSRFILEAAGLNILNAVVTRLFGDRKVQLNCAAANLEVKEGLMTTRGFVIDTEEAVIDITGGIDMGDEALALTLRPQSKGVRILSLRAPLHVGGTFKNPDVGIDKATLALRGGGAAALGAIAPVAALLPLISAGETDLAEDNGCAALLAEAKRAAEAPPAGQPAN